jgi:hypothetical protein
MRQTRAFNNRGTLLKQDELTETITIPTNLFNKILEKTKNTSFSSVSEYVTYVLKKDLSEFEDDKVFSEEDEKKIKDRLRRLGYL